jgi:hypothetical protein
MSQTDLSKRLPITRRVRPAKNTPLTDRAKDIIRAVGTYRRLTSWQIERLFFPPGPNGELNSQCKMWLRRLFHDEYLYRSYQKSYPDEGRLPLVYCLDTKGVALLSEDDEFELTYKPSRADVRSEPLAHDLATNDVRIAIDQSIERHGWELVQWIPEWVLKDPKHARFDRVPVNVAAEGDPERILTLRVIPDGYFVIRAPGEQGELVKFHHFLETDMGTESNVGKWYRKVKAHRAYTTPGPVVQTTPEGKHGRSPSPYERRYGTTSLKILTVTTSEVRLAHMKAATEAAGGKGRFWFTTHAQVQQADPLTDPIWQLAGRDGCYAVIPQRQERAA